MRREGKFQRNPGPTGTRYEKDSAAGCLVALMAPVADHAKLGEYILG